MRQKPVIGVDLDGVCADFYARMREIAAEWFELPIGELTPDVSYGLSEWGVTEGRYDSLHRFALHQRDLFRTMPMIPGARKYLRKLSDEGHHIRIITHRLFIHYSHASAVQQTVEWLDGHGIPYWDLCFMKEKSAVVLISMLRTVRTMSSSSVRGDSRRSVSQTVRMPISPPLAPNRGRRCMR